jgi:hypothetical protein
VRASKSACNLVLKLVQPFCHGELTDRDDGGPRFYGDLKGGGTCDVYITCDSIPDQPNFAKLSLPSTERATDE